MAGRTCVTCSDEIGEERWAIGFRYCMKRECVRANHRGLVIVEIGQTKTNAEYAIMTEQVLRDMREGKYRRDPIVVQRQPSHGGKVQMRARPAALPTYNRWRVRFVQALADQGVRVDDILQRGAYMGLTRREVHHNMAGKRI